MHRITMLIFGLAIICSVSGQSGDEKVQPGDSSQFRQILFTPSSASEYLIDLLSKNDLFKPAGDTMKHSLQRLIDHAVEPFDSVSRRLGRFSYDSIKPHPDALSKSESIPVRWLNDSTFIIDTIALIRQPFTEKLLITKKIIDTAEFHERVTDLEELIDYMLEATDTAREIHIDTAFLNSYSIQLHKISHKRIIPPLLPPYGNKTAHFSKDSTKVIVNEVNRVLVADERSPFYIIPDERMPDSLKAAVHTLLAFTDDRDSVKLFISDVHGRKIPFWLTNKNDDLYRFWVRNYRNDSITIWIGNSSKNDLTLILEDDVNVDRIRKETAEDIPFTLAKPDLSLAKVEPVKGLPVYWNFNFSSSMTLNQTFLSNWSKGGESSLSSIIETLGTARYTDNEAHTQWTNTFRAKYGNIITEEYGWRTNTDMFEINSQYNKLLKDKFDLSAIFYGKSQFARGYKYPNDSVVVSKFLNPGTFTLGVGVEYKPSKTTSINFSALSYKNTFVLDTAHINQKTHGIDKDKRSKQEMGGQLLVKNTVKLFDGLNVSNTLRLFSGYLNHPENIDVDWEVNLEKSITWYLGIKMNLHMIYDDDIRFPVLDSNDQPIVLPDGTKKLSPKLQFKEILGFSLLFKF